MSATKSTQEVFEVLESHLGITDVLVRSVNESGELKEQTVAMKDLPQDPFTDGIVIEDGNTVYPDKKSIWLNPFDEKPVLALICYANEHQPLADSSQTPAFPSQLSPGFSTSGMFLQSPLVQDWSSRPQYLYTPSDMHSALGAMLATPHTPMNPMYHNMPAPQALNIPPQVKKTPGVGDDKAKTQKTRKLHGTSCHQCKNARTPEQLAMCSNTFQKRHGGDQRPCRKKFCQTCLSKFYNDSVENSKRNEWYCPSCKGMCKCASCVRKRGSSGSDAFMSPVKTQSLKRHKVEDFPLLNAE